MPATGELCLAEVLGTASNCAELRTLIASRRKSLALTQMQVREMAGVQGGDTGKIECDMKHFGDVSPEAQRRLKVAADAIK